MSYTYVVSDLHGRVDILEAALERIEASPSGGKVVFTGDYIDRGPDSSAVMDRLMAGPTKTGWKWVCLKGNHEDMMVDALQGGSEPSGWLINGGAQTLASFGRAIPDEYVKWASRLPVMHCDGKRIYVHAGVDPVLSLEHQTEAMLLWSRVPKHTDYCHPEGYVVHGHTPVADGPIILGGRANFDTGAVWTGHLVVGVFDDKLPGGPVKLMSVQCPSLAELESNQ